MEKNSYYLIAHDEEILIGLQMYVSKVPAAINEYKYSLGYAVSDELGTRIFACSDDVPANVIENLSSLPGVEVVESFLMEQLAEEELDME